MVKSNLDDELGCSGSHSPLRPVLQRLGPPGAFPGEAGRAAQCLEPLGQSRPLFIGDGGRETDMIELALVIKEPEK